MNVTYTTGVGRFLLTLFATVALSGCMSAAEQAALKIVRRALVMVSLRVLRSSPIA